MINYLIVINVISFRLWQNRMMYLSFLD